MRYFFTVQARIGLLLMLAASAVMLGWIVRSAVLVQLHPSLVGMVFNTAFCFFVIGVALLAPQVAPNAAARIQTGAGAMVIVLGCLALLETVADLGISVDNRALHAWLHDGNPRPGRMAPNTVLGFVLAGLVLILLERARSRLICAIIQIATFGVLLLGLTGLVGYSLELNLLYRWFDAPHMALHTALCMGVLSIGLWCSWRRADWYQSRRFFDDGEKIGLIGSGILIAVAVTIGVAGFAAQETTLKNTFSDILPQILKSHTTIFHTAIRNGIADARAVADRQDLIRLTKLVNDAPDNVAAIALLEQIGRSVMASGITGLALYDKQDRQILQLGQFSSRPDVRIDLRLTSAATLLWDRGLFLHSRTALAEQEKAVGAIEIEQPLPLITEQLKTSAPFGDDGVIDVCAVQGGQLLCLPQRGNLQVHQVSRMSANGTPTPMHFAVQGQAGNFRGMDYRGHNVIAAYAPLISPGLGMVVKQETEALYAPVRKQLQWSFPLLLLLVTIGAIILHSQIRPLVLRLMRSERDAIDKEQNMRTVVDSAGEGIIMMNEAGVIESFNNAATQIFGYATSEVVGHNIMMLMPHELRPAHQAGMQRYLATGEAHIVGRRATELTGLHKCGKVFDLELTTNEMVIGERRLFVGIVRDVTEHKHAQKVLLEAHAELERRVSMRTAELENANRLLMSEVEQRRVIEDALLHTKVILTHAQMIGHMGSWQINIKTGAMEWSDEFWRICGLEPSSIAPTIELAISCLHPDDQDGARDGLRFSLEQHAHYKRERRIVRPDGSVRHVMSQGEIIRDANHEAVMLIGIFLDITDYRQAVDALEQTQARLREMAAHQDRVEEEERKRVAREIHDELGGVLTGIKSYLSYLVDNAERLGTQPDRHLVDASALANSAIETVRRIITDLRPSVLDQLGLWAALDWYSRAIEQSSGLACELSIDSATAAVPIDAERSTAVFRIVQESLTNVTRHAKASQVRIAARIEQGILIMTLQDNGVGIPPPHQRNQGSWGIVGMVERARYFGGDIHIAGLDGHGTTVTLHMPTENPDD